MTAQQTPEDHSQFDIAIIGGGIGGAILAIGLQKYNVKFQIYEAAKEFGEIGAGVSCSPNAVTALSLISPDLFAAYKKHETPNMSGDLSYIFTMVRHGTDDTERSEPRWKAGDLAFVNEGKAECPPDILRRGSVHRARFLDEIVKLVPDNVANFGKPLVRLEQLPEAEGGRYRMHFGDDTTAEADAVIGCDGVKSVTRSFLYDKDVQPKYTGTHAYRALIPADEVEAAIGSDRTFNGTVSIGPNRYVIHYPVDHGTMINAVATLWEEGAEWPEDNSQIPCDNKEILSEFKHFQPEFIKLMSKHGATAKWGLFDLEHERPYYKGNVCLLGDSCHAMSPHLGAGAGQAIEDAYVMSNLLGQVKTRADIEKAFHAFDAVRRPRSQLIVKDSRESGASFQMRHPECGDDPEKIHDVQQRLLNDTWDVDLKDHLRQAVELMAH